MTNISLKKEVSALQYEIPQLDQHDGLFSNISHTDHRNSGKTLRG